MKKVLAGMTAIVLLIVSCTKTNEVALTTPPPAGSTPTGNSCDTVNMKYLANVQPIIQANCYSCHGNGQAQSGISLDSYTKLKQQVNNGNLVGVITHAAGYPPMPYNLPKLSDCDINKVKAWIARGALNN